MAGYRQPILTRMLGRLFYLILPLLGEPGDRRLQALYYSHKRSSV